MKNKSRYRAQKSDFELSENAGISQNKRKFWESFIRLFTSASYMLLLLITSTSYWADLKFSPYIFTVINYLMT